MTFDGRSKAALQRGIKKERSEELWPFLQPVVIYYKEPKSFVCSWLVHFATIGDFISKGNH